jgi:hypothetical protein
LYYYYYLNIIIKKKSIYQAALTKIGPPIKVIGAINPPSKHACANQAACLADILPSW